MVLRPCLTKNATDSVVIGLYEEQQARTSPGFNDLLGEPILSDTDNDGIAEEWALVRPETEVQLKAIVKFISADELMAQPSGNVGDSVVSVSLFEEELRSKNLIDLNDKVKIRVNDRLLRVLDGSGRTKAEFVEDERIGLFATHVIPPDTGEEFREIIFQDRMRGPRD